MSLSSGDCITRNLSAKNFFTLCSIYCVKCGDRIIALATCGTTYYTIPFCIAKRRGSRSTSICSMRLGKHPKYGGSVIHLAYPLGFGKHWNILLRFVTLHHEHVYSPQDAHLFRFYSICKLNPLRFNTINSATLRQSQTQNSDSGRDDAFTWKDWACPDCYDMYPTRGVLLEHMQYDCNFISAPAKGRLKKFLVSFLLWILE